MSETKKHIKRIEQFIATWEVPTEEIKQIKQRISIVEPKIKFMHEHRGAVSGSSLGTEVIGLKGRLDEIEKMKSTVQENKEFVVEFREEEKILESLNREREELEAKVKEQEIEYNFIKNHPEIFEQYTSKIDELMTEIAELTKENEVLTKEIAKL